jgi:Fe-S-cluster containining protein
MSERHIAELHNHHLDHCRPLRVDPILFEATFEHACSMQNCNASCCQHGVMVDVKERDNILQHAGLIHRYMDNDQIRDPQAWFEEKVEQDADYPSGQAAGTETDGCGCVFLRRDGRCVLQVAAEGEGTASQALKPFFCFAFPITIESGVLTIDDPQFTNRPQCCSMIPGGSRSVLEVCRFELEFVLGSKGLKELLALRGSESVR